MSCRFLHPGLNDKGITGVWISLQFITLWEQRGGHNTTVQAKIMHVQELLFVSASRQLLAASRSSLRHNPTSRKIFFAVRSWHRKNFFLLKNPDRKNFFAATFQKEGDIQNLQQDGIFRAMYGRISGVIRIICKQTSQWCWFFTTFARRLVAW